MKRKPTKGDKIRARRLLLWNERGGLCHWCGFKTILPQGDVPGFPRMATLDHLDDRYQTGKPGRNRHLTRIVLSCLKCNQERASESEREYAERTGRRNGLPPRAERRKVTAMGPPSEASTSRTAAARSAS